MEKYWVYRWLDEHGIKDATKAGKLLASDKGLASLIEALPHTHVRHSVVDAKTSIVAGRGLDLSGQLDCNAAECRRRQADDLFRHVWHYFDNIIVADAVAHELHSHENADPKDLREWLGSHLQVLLYLREMGAEELLTFEMKRPACEVHWIEHAKEAGLSVAADESGDIAARLANEANIRFEREAEAGRVYVFEHPEFEHSVWTIVESRNAAQMGDEELRTKVARSVLQRYVAHLSSDVMAAKEASAPLGSTLALHRALLQQQTPTVAAAAFEIQLPILQNVSVADLVRVRAEERELFERFQRNLRVAIAERIRQGGTARDADIAEEIQRDLIEPELERIRTRLVAAEQLLSRKTAISIGVGALGTLCGLVSGVGGPVVAAAGLSGLLVAGGTHLGKYLEQRSDIAESDFYFLWRASEHAH